MSSAGAWLVDRGDDGSRWPVPDLTMTLLLDHSSVHCSDIIITATGEAARLWPECLGTFSSQPGEFYCGRQVFRNTTGLKLQVSYYDGYWSVVDGKGRAGLRSGSAPGMCPADPRAKIDVDGTRNWMYVNREGEWEESSDIIITCSTHPHSNDSSPPDVPRPEDRQPVQVPEEAVREEVTIGASADTATGAKKKISKAPKTDVGLDCSDERKTDGGPGHVSKRSQECGSTPPASSSGQKEEEPRDGAAAGAVGGEDSSRNSQTGSAAGVHVDGETKMRDRKICWNCHDPEDLKRCNGCYMAWYCDKRCQRADRTRHKKFCKKQKRRRMEQAIFHSREDEVD